MVKMETKFWEFTCEHCDNPTKTLIKQGGVITTETLRWGRECTYITHNYDSYCSSCGTEASYKERRLIDSENPYLDFIMLPALIGFVVFVVCGDLIFKGVG